MFFLQYVQIEYQNLDYKNYLVLRQKQIVQPIDYCCRMVEQNHINGLLPMYSKRLNDRTDFFYDISGKQRLSDYLKNICCTDEQGRQILLNMAESLKNLPQYFLKQSLCIMDLQYVFINNALQIFFPLLPLVEMLDNPNNIQDFFRRIVSDYFVTEANNQFYDGLLKYLSRQQFDLPEFIERLQPKTSQAETPVYSVQPAVVSEPVAEPVIKADKPALRWPFGGKSNKEDNKPEKTEKKPKNQVELAPQGINIPGVPEPSPVPEKKHLFGGKKNKEKPVKEKTVKEKTVKEPKPKTGLFGGKAKDKQKKNEQPLSVPNMVPPNIPVQATPTVSEYVQPVPMPVVSENFDETVYLAEPRGTDCYLYHNNYRVNIIKTPFLLGKQNVDYQINKGFISRVHAVITQENAEYFIQDENSKNHTYLNGEQLPPYTPYKLNNGSKIRLGSEELTFYNENDK